MSLSRSRNHWKAYASAALTLWTLATGGAKAQITFSALDWTVDRGQGNVPANSFLGTNGTQNGSPTRTGTNNFTGTGNDPSPGAKLWTFPFTRDTYGIGNATVYPVYSIVDNPNPADNLIPQSVPSLDPSGTGGSRYLPYAPLTNTGSAEAGPGYTAAQANAGKLPGFATLARPFAVFGNGAVSSWVIPAVGFGTGNGYSRSNDSSKSYSFDYDYVLAKHDDFLIPNGNGGTTKLLDGDALQFPYVSPTIYRAVNSRLIRSITPAIPSDIQEPYARWASGQVEPGRYSVDIFSPGSGTNLNTLANPINHPGESRVFVRVSWKGTVNGTTFVEGTGAAGAGGINDPANSRIYCIDMSVAGRIRLQGAAGDAGFPYDGDPANQLVVTLYTLTPDTLDPTNGNAPVITADAVQFTGTLLPTATGLGPVGTQGGYIAATGRILGSAVSSANIPAGTNGTLTAPLFYFAREEFTADATLRLSDPTDPNSALVADPAGLARVPVFYCIDSRVGNTTIVGNAGTYITSKDKVVWRYAGTPFPSGASGTSVGSPVLANVRRRDGSIQPMIYFTTTTGDNTQGQIYALDPIGDKTLGTTQCYWAYPSVRPLLGNEAASAGLGAANQSLIPSVYQDPNYTTLFARPVQYPNTLAPLAADLSVSGGRVFYYDGDIINGAGANGLRIPQVNPKTLITLGGITGSPMVADDPDNAAGAQLLIVPSMNGRVYAFDAGGRGDYGDPALSYTLPGTTQRIWTWPHFNADGSRHPAAFNTLVGGEDTKYAFPTTPAMFNTAGPMVLGGGITNVGGKATTSGGRLYAINLGHDVFSQTTLGYTFNNRLVWQYPNNSTNLGAIPSTVSIFDGEGTFGKPYVYFTSGGRVYSVDPSSVTPQNPVAGLHWVFPYSTNPPADDYGVASSTALNPGFQGNAPLLYRDNTLGSTLNPVRNYFCTVVDAVGTVYTLDALASATPQQTTLLASNTYTSGTNTQTSPILALMTGQSNFSTDTTTTRPTIFFGNDAGLFAGYAVVPNPTPAGYSPEIYQRQNEGAHTGDATLSNGILGIGDNIGIYHAYGHGGGVNGQGDLGGPEPPIPGRDVVLAPIDDGTVDIDIRSVDIYDPLDYADFMRSTAGGKTPAPGVGVNPTGNDLAIGKTIIREWGDGVFVAASGVFHALKQDPMLALSGTDVPDIEVFFKINGQTIQVRATQRTDSPPVPLGWPIDAGFPVGSFSNLKMVGSPDGSSNFVTLQNPNYEVYPWVAKIPDAQIRKLLASDLPGSNFKIIVNATILQPYQTYDGMTITPGVGSKGGSSVEMQIGQRDAVGKSNSRTQLPTTTGVRNFIVANPIALTAQGYVAPATLPSPSSLIGWFGNIGGLSDALKYEIIGNGNFTTITDPNTGTYTPITTGLPSEKDIFAPVGMIQDGSSKDYTAYKAGNFIQGFYLADRSHYIGLTGAKLKMQVVTTQLGWKGGASSVMNPLPYDTMPSDSEASADYPPISADNLAFLANGQNLVTQYVNIEQIGLTTPDTPFNLRVTIPKFQPANVNYGIVSDLVHGNYGATVQDNNGQIRGATGSSLLLNGPLDNRDGNPLPVKNAFSYPSGGYTGQIQVNAPPGANGGTVGSQASKAFKKGTIFAGKSNGGGSGGGGTAFRSMAVGTSVPPSVRMSMETTTIDLGKMSHGAGYTDLPNGGPNFSVPFTPFGGYDPTTGNEGTAPWSSYFRPFTLRSASNINLTRLRIAKLFGEVAAPLDYSSLTKYPNQPIGSGMARKPGSIASLQIGSADVNDVTTPPIFGMGFAPPSSVKGLGSIGLVSSFDHALANTNLFLPVSPNYRENDLWSGNPTPQIKNPFITAQGISAAGLPTADGTYPGELGWQAGVQREPTLHKPRPNDAQGTIATVPDLPYGANLNLLYADPNNQGSGTTFKTELPKLSLAIPLGTPSGTYKANVVAYEDETPFQWRNWLANSTGGVNLGANADGVLNSLVNDPTQLKDYALEPYTVPGSTVQVTVVENRLTNTSSKGSLGQIDPMVPVDTQAPALSANMMPTAVTFLAPLDNNSVSNNGVRMFWVGNRQSQNAVSPWNLYTAFLPTSTAVLPNTSILYGDANFGNPQNGFSSRWWAGLSLFTGVDSGNAALTNPDLFPSNTTEAQKLFTLYLPGIRQDKTARVTNPAATRLETVESIYSNEGMLFWQGQIIKTIQVASGQNQQVTDSRTFYQMLVRNVSNGDIVTAGATQSFPNDPALAKLNPKPLYVSVGGQKVVFLFWQAGNRSNAQLYYNVNSDTASNFAYDKWSTDTILPVPAALSFASEPTAVLRKFVNPADLTKPIYAVDVAYSGQFKGRKNVELLMSRYQISDDGKFTLTPISIPAAYQELVLRDGAAHSYVSRDSAWQLPAFNANGTLLNQIRIEVDNNSGNLTLLNVALDPKTGQPITDNNGQSVAQKGTFDPASGLLYFNSSLGGQIIVDTRSGSVSFPNVTPNSKQRVFLSYTPKVMRLNVARYEPGFVLQIKNASQLQQDPGQDPGNVDGNNTNPTMILDRSHNLRNRGGAGSTVYDPSGVAYSPYASYDKLPSLSRRWLIYRKTNSVTGAGIYYKAQRLMIQLPNAIGSLNAIPIISSPNGIPIGLQGTSYEVDFLRGRIYFDETLEGQTVTVNYTDTNGTSPLPSTYVIKWGDELTTSKTTREGGTDANPIFFTTYYSAVETKMPIDTQVNEGQIAAYKDPFLDKLWVYWSSTRNGVADLYFQTISPQTNLTVTK